MAGGIYHAEPSTTVLTTAACQDDSQGLLWQRGSSHGQVLPLLPWKALEKLPQVGTMHWTYWLCKGLQKRYGLNMSPKNHMLET